MLDSFSPQLDSLPPFFKCTREFLREWEAEHPEMIWAKARKI
jgi:hypothetical protein